MGNVKLKNGSRPVAALEWGPPITAGSSPPVYRFNPISLLPTKEESGRDGVYK
jgi:hypothetical protein